MLKNGPTNSSVPSNSARDIKASRRLRQSHNISKSPETGWIFNQISNCELFQAIGKLRKEARDEIDRLIGFLDKTDDYVSRELEDSIDDGPHDDNELDGPENAEDEESEPDEPSLGAFEGDDDQSVSWKCGNRSDRELDAAESGIGDQGGLDEQVPFRDWQNRGMV
jgi:hypothetical protein